MRGQHRERLKGMNVTVPQDLQCACIGECVETIFTADHDVINSCARSRPVTRQRLPKVALMTVRCLRPLAYMPCSRRVWP